MFVFVQIVKRRYRSYDENDLKLALSQKSLRLGEKLTGIPCSTLVNYKNKQSQNFVRIRQQPNLPDDALEELLKLWFDARLAEAMLGASGKSWPPPSGWLTLSMDSGFSVAFGSSGAGF